MAIAGSSQTKKPNDNRSNEGDTPIKLIQIDNSSVDDTPPKSLDLSSPKKAVHFLDSKQ